MIERLTLDYRAAVARKDRAENRVLNSRDIQVRVKYLGDRVLAFLLFIALLPFLVVISILIWVSDRGAPWFLQERLGRYGRIFKMFKFRTMIVNADDFLDAQGRVTDQRRITAVGRWLRYSSLDELPQLMNIIKGEMSFIGPRPAVPEHLSRYTEDQKQRLQMRPGVTGLSQVRGRNTLTWSRRIRFDIEYIDNYSLWLDLKILALTLRVVLRGEGIVLDRNPDHADDLGPELQRSSEDGGGLSK